MGNLLQTLKRRWADFLQRLAGANRDSFGAGGPGCCNPDAKRAAKKSAS